MDYLLNWLSHVQLCAYIELYSWLPVLISPRRPNSDSWWWCFPSHPLSHILLPLNLSQHQRVFSNEVGSSSDGQSIGACLQHHPSQWNIQVFQHRNWQILISLSQGTLRSSQHHGLKSINSLGAHLLVSQEMEGPTWLRWGTIWNKPVLLML